MVGGLQTASRDLSSTRLRKVICSNAEVNNAWSFTSTSLYIFMARCLNTKATLPLTSDNYTSKTVSLEWMGWHAETLFRSVL
jgi:hypothetical protein